jgi:VWFA-related protein
MVSVLFALVLGLQAQESKQAPQEDFVISTDVEMVLLDVSVRNSEGGYVSDLTAENFTILENNKPQKITLFRKVDSPVTIGLVVDNSRSMIGRRPGVIQAALDLISASNPKDETFVVNFNDTATLGLPQETPFSSNISELKAALDRDPPAGRTSLYDAIALALNHIQAGRQDKKTLVVLSDGGDNASEIDLEKVLRLAQEEMITMYSVGLYDLFDKDRNPRVLRRLAKETGGEAFFPKTAGEIAGDCLKIATDIRNRYTIGYVPVHGEKAEYRKLRVKASAPGRGGLEVLARAGYRMHAPHDSATASVK